MPIADRGAGRGHRAVAARRVDRVDTDDRIYTGGRVRTRDRIVTIGCADATRRAGRMPAGRAW